MGLCLYISLNIVRAWYVRLITLNVPHVPRPCFIAPKLIVFVICTLYGNDKKGLLKTCFKGCVGWFVLHSRQISVNNSSDNQSLLKKLMFANNCLETTGQIVRKYSSPAWGKSSHYQEHLLSLPGMQRDSRVSFFDILQKKTL